MVGLVDNRGQARGDLGRDQNGVDLLANEVGDVSYLLVRVVEPVGNNELDVRVLGRLLPQDLVK